MTQYEALKLSCGVIERLEAAGVRPSDHKYLRMFEDWREAEQRGEKVVYIVACLAAKYGVSEKTVYNVLKRLGSDCKSVSVERSGEVLSKPQKRPKFAPNANKQVLCHARQDIAARQTTEQ